MPMPIARTREAPAGGDAYGPREQEPCARGPEPHSTTPASLPEPASEPEEYRTPNPVHSSHPAP